LAGANWDHDIKQRDNSVLGRALERDIEIGSVFDPFGSAALAHAITVSSTGLRCLAGRRFGLHEAVSERYTASARANRGLQLDRRSMRNRSQRVTIVVIKDRLRISAKQTRSALSPATQRQPIQQ
jgi:hypothetical protein